ncbi:hypothetical protein DXG01_011605 [Tephrocybe rancida]|nr:hypothetical protein DXG01_011605 [Tephrocybe rancida]
MYPTTRYCQYLHFPTYTLWDTRSINAGPLADNLRTFERSKYSAMIIASRTPVIWLPWQWRVYVKPSSPIDLWLKKCSTKPSTPDELMCTLSICVVHPIDEPDCPFIDSPRHDLFLHVQAPQYPKIICTSSNCDGHAIIDTYTGFSDDNVTPYWMGFSSPFVFYQSRESLLDFITSASCQKFDTTFLVDQIMSSAITVVPASEDSDELVWDLKALSLQDS